MDSDHFSRNILFVDSVVLASKEGAAPSEIQKNGEIGFSMSPRNGSCVAEVSSVRSLSSDDVSATKNNRKRSCWARATDPAHRRGRRIQLLQMLVLPFIPILALIVQTANTLHDILIYRQEVSDIETQVNGETS